MNNRKARTPVLLAMMLAAAGIAFWWWQQRADPAAQAGSTSATASSADVAASASKDSADATPPDAAAVPQDATRPAVAPTFDAPLPQGPIGETYAELVRRANAGDGAAAMALARTLALCIDYTPEQRSKVEDSLVEFAAHSHDLPGDDEAASSDRFVDLAMGVLDRRDAECPGIDDLGIADRAAERDRWLALGLDLGHPAALVQEANDMLKKRYPRRTDIINHAEELRALRPQAMAMLQRAAAQGEPIALLRTATAHHSGDLAERDPVAAYAYVLAYRAGPPASEVPQLVSDDIARRLSADLTAEQIQAAEARAAQIRARCCGEG